MLELIQVSTSMVSAYKISINLDKTFLRISRIRNIPLTWILARVFVYVPPFISQILNLTYWTALLFILIYFEWRDIENQQYFSKALFEELIFGGAYLRRGLSTEGNLRFKIDLTSLTVPYSWKEIYRFCFVLLRNWGKLPRELREFYGT